MFNISWLHTKYGLTQWWQLITCVVHWWFSNHQAHLLYWCVENMSFYEYLSLKPLSLPLHSVDNCWFLDGTEAPWEALWVFGLRRLSPVMNGNMCTYHHIINLLLCERKHTKNGAKLESEPHHTYEAEVFWKYDRLSTNMDKLRDKEQFTEVSHNNMGMNNVLTNVAPNVSVCCCSCLGVFITVLNRLHTCYSSTNLFISLAAHLSIQQKFLPAGHRH